MLRMNFPGRKEDRKKSVGAGRVEREKRSPKQQLKVLDERLGKGIGAKKERERLNKIIRESSEVTQESSEAVKVVEKPKKRSKKV